MRPGNYQTHQSALVRAMETYAGRIPRTLSLEDSVRAFATEMKIEGLGVNRIREALISMRQFESPYPGSAR